MRPWAYALSGLLIWGLHFAGVYAIASLDALTSKDDEGAWRAANLGFSAVCILGCLLMLVVAVRRNRRVSEDTLSLLDSWAIWSPAGGLIAVLWQSLATLL